MFSGKNQNGQYTLFWERMKEEYAPNSPTFSHIKPGPRNFMGRAAGITGVNLTFNMDKGAGIVQLDVKYNATSAKQEVLKKFTEFLKQNRQQIEAEMGTELVWNDLYHAFSIQKYIPAPGFFVDQTTWIGVRKGMAEWMKKFEDVFVPLVQKFKYGCGATTIMATQQESQSMNVPTETEVPTEAPAESEAIAASQPEESEPVEQPTDDVSDSSPETMEETYIPTGDDMPLPDEQEFQDQQAI